MIKYLIKLTMILVKASFYIFFCYLNIFLGSIVIVTSNPKVIEEEFKNDSDMNTDYSKTKAKACCGKAGII